MIVIGSQGPEPAKEPLLRAMFEARKQVFVDLLKWDVPVLDGRYEIDQFDDEHAVYLIVADTAGGHLGSARLLPTTRPHILDSLFPNLCAGEPPRNSGCLEITRFCLGRNQNARERLETRNRLVSAIAQFALENGISTYTGVAELAWLQQILGISHETVIQHLKQARERYGVSKRTMLTVSTLFDGTISFIDVLKR